jgi:zinc transporter
MAVTTATLAGESAEPEVRTVAGLVCAFRFHADGSSEELDVDRPIAEQGGWLWLHFNLADTRARHFLSSFPHLPPPARSQLVSADEHQQLHGDDTCLYGILADLVCGLDGATEEIGFLHFAATENSFITSRRHHLSAVEATRHALRRGLKVETPLALLEVITGQMIEVVDQFAEKLAAHLDRAEEMILAEEMSVDRRVIGSARRMTVRLHRQLVTLRAIIQRFEHDTGKSSNSVLSLPTEKLAQRLNWLDMEIVELRDRARLLQEEITLKAAEQTNRNLHVLSTVTTIFLPASLVAGIFGMNVAGLPLLHDTSGFLWAMVILVAASALVYWSLKRSGILRR